MDRKLHVDTLISIPTLKTNVFWYSKRTDGWMDGQMDRDTCCAWAGQTVFLLSYRGYFSPFTLCVCIARSRLVIHVNNKYISTDFFVEPKFSSCT
jgi:hypothetical protein